MVLTPKQEKFIQGIVNGLTNRDAYKEAYDTENMSDAAIDVEASRLLRNPNVALRHKEIMDALAIPSIMSAQERLEYLTRLIKEEEKEKVLTLAGTFMEKPADFNSKLKAIDLMNKMQGEYVTKVEGNIGVTKLEDLL